MYKTGKSLTYDSRLFLLSSIYLLSPRSLRFFILENETRAQLPGFHFVHMYMVYLFINYQKDAEILCAARGLDNQRTYEESRDT